ncbi:hypothetical protein C4577_05620 [Candidatus Parcubacteria bacterium]|nr:MAG: hypothetical protein C4577_05620 [Candidatus Parcubacteria bacterium]
MENLEERIEKIEKRNQKVERDKVWETSFTRRILLIVFTYLAIAIYFEAIGVDRPFLNAVVPATGFLLSTLTLPYFKHIWEKYIYKK